MEWSRSVFELFLGTLPDAAIVVEAGHLIVLANPRAVEMFGCPRHELAGESVAALFPARTDAEEAMRWFCVQPPDGATTAIRELTLRRRDGQLFSADVTRGPVTLEGQPLVLAILRELSERRRGDDELRKSEERLRQAVRVSEIGIFDHDHRTDIHYWSPRQRQLYGWGEAEEVTVPSFLAILHPDDRAAIATAIRNAHDPTGDGFFDVEHRIKHRDGGTRWIATRSRTIFSGEGAARRPVRTVGASVDLTERKVAEAALDLFRHSVDQASEAIFWLERDGRFSYVNERACRSLGYTRDELMRLRVWDIDVTYPRALWDEHWERFERLHESVTGRAETFHRRKDGTAFPVEVVCQHIPLQGRSLHIAYARDISERRQAEEARARLVAILDATPDFVDIAAPDGRLLYLNQSARRLLGIAPGDDISERRVPHDQPEWARRLILETAIPAAVRDGMWKGEAAFLDKSGREVPCSLVLVAHKSADGALSFLSTIARDLSKEKDLEAQFLHAQKMEAVGRLAGGVAHDFNNLLSAILSFARLAQERLPPDHPSYSDMNEVGRAGERAAELVRQMLAFSRKQVMQPRVVDVNQVLTSIVPMIRRLIGEDIELTVSLAPHSAPIKADPCQLEQVIVNLAINARDAMPEGGKLTLDTQNVMLNEAYAEAHLDTTPGPHVMIGISDTGQGMEAATKARIFEPFFTTKAPGQGTGLGLSMVFGIVKQSGGTIWVYSEVGRGTTFKLYFPRSDEAISSPALLGTAAPPGPVVGAVVLLVEDEEQLRRLGAIILRHSGYEVLEASDALTALEMARAYPGRIDLLLTDVVMPQMSGKQLAERLLEERPGLHILYMSGYTEDTIVHHGVLDKNVRFLAKPITPDVLLATVRRTLVQPEDQPGA